MGSGASSDSSGTVTTPLPQPARKLHGEIGGAAFEKAVRGIEALLNGLPHAVRASAIFRAAARCEVNLVAEAASAARKSMVRAAWTSTGAAFWRACNALKCSSSLLLVAVEVAAPAVPGEPHARAVA